MPGAVGQLFRMFALGGVILGIDENSGRALAAETAAPLVLRPIALTFNPDCANRHNVGKPAKPECRLACLASKYNRFGVPHARLRLCRSNAMNVCNEGGPIVAFRESPESRRAS